MLRSRIAAGERTCHSARPAGCSRQGSGCLDFWSPREFPVRLLQWNWLRRVQRIRQEPGVCLVRYIEAKVFVSACEREDQQHWHRQRCSVSPAGNTRVWSANGFASLVVSDESTLATQRSTGRGFKRQYLARPSFVLSPTGYRKACPAGSPELSRRLIPRCAAGRDALLVIAHLE